MVAKKAVQMVVQKVGKLAETKVGKDLRMVERKVGTSDERLVEKMVGMLAVMKGL